MKFREVALTLFWRPPPCMEGVNNFAFAGSVLGFAAGYFYFQGGPHPWLCIPAALIGDLAGKGVYLVLLLAGLLRTSPPKAPL
jgi:hypothetical protein